MYPTYGLGAGAAASPDANAAYDAASNAAAAIAADSNYCVSVGQVGSPVNSAVHAFKAAYNAWVAGGDPDSPSTALPINTGRYEPVVAAALASLLGSGPTGCSGVTPPPPAQQVVCADGSTHPAGFVCPQVTCPDGTTHPDGYVCPSAPAPAASTTPWGWIIGGVAVLAVGGVALVAVSKSRGATGAAGPAAPHRVSVRRMPARRRAPMNRRLPAYARA